MKREMSSREYKETGHKCKCGGEILEYIIEMTYVPEIFGPRSNHNERKEKISKGFHCEKCGLMYWFVKK